MIRSRRESHCHHNQVSRKHIFYRCGISVSCCVIYSTLHNTIILTSLKIVLVWIIAGLRRKNIRGVDECKQTFLEERTAVTSCMCQQGRAGVGHGTLCQPTCFDDHTHMRTHTPCQHAALVSELGFAVRSH